jgi:hypothetical protein
MEYATLTQARPNPKKSLRRRQRKKYVGIVQTPLAIAVTAEIAVPTIFCADGLFLYRLWPLAPISICQQLNSLLSVFGPCGHGRTKTVGTEKKSMTP